MDKTLVERLSEAAIAWGNCGHPDGGLDEAAFRDLGFNYGYLHTESMVRISELESQLAEQTRLAEERKREVEQLKLKEAVLMDLHTSLGVKWGEDPYAAIVALRESEVGNVARILGKVPDQLCTAYPGY